MHHIKPLLLRMIINYLKLDPQNEAKMGQYLTGGGGIWTPPKIQMLYFLTKNYLKINNYAKIIPVNPLSPTPRIKNLFKKPKKSDYQCKIGGGLKYPPPVKFDLQISPKYSNN